MEKKKGWGGPRNDDEPFLISYIKMSRDMYEEDTEIYRIYEWILDNGTMSIGMDIELSDKVVEENYRKPKLKECYYNSLLRFDNLDYVEGWANLIIPMNHAWNTVDGKVVDVTMTLPEHREDNKWTKRATQEYFGVNIPRDWIRENLPVGTKYRREWTDGPFIFDYALKCMREE